MRVAIEGDRDEDMDVGTDIGVRPSRAASGVLTFSERISQAVANAEAICIEVDKNAFANEQDTIEIRRDVTGFADGLVVQFLGRACLVSLVFVPLLIALFIFVITAN